MSVQVLVERDALRKLLKDLVSSGHLELGLYVEGKRRLEGLWRDYFDAAELSCFLRDFFYVVDRVFEFLLGWGEDRHGVDKV